MFELEFALPDDTAREVQIWLGTKGKPCTKELATNKWPAEKTLTWMLDRSILMGNYIFHLVDKEDPTCFVDSAVFAVPTPVKITIEVTQQPDEEITQVSGCLHVPSCRRAVVPSCRRAVVLWRARTPWARSNDVDRSRPSNSGVGLPASPACLLLCVGMGMGMGGVLGRVPCAARYNCIAHVLLFGWVAARRRRRP